MSQATAHISPSGVELAGARTVVAVAEQMVSEHALEVADGKRNVREQLAHLGEFIKKHLLPITTSVQLESCGIVLWEYRSVVIWPPKVEKFQELLLRNVPCPIFVDDHEEKLQDFFAR